MKESAREKDKRKQTQSGSTAHIQAGIVNSFSGSDTAVQRYREIPGRYEVQWNIKCLWKFYIAIKSCVAFCALDERVKNTFTSVEKSSVQCRKNLCA